MRFAALGRRAYVVTDRYSVGITTSGDVPGKHVQVDNEL